MSKRVVILGYSSSVHIVRWVNGISQAGYDVHLISLGGKPIKGIQCSVVDYKGNRRFGYLKNLYRVRNLIQKLSPDLLHSHYASSYGLWGAFSGFHPHIISVWGSDVVSFPSTFFKKMILRRILNSADALTASGQFLREKTELISPKNSGQITVIPFGVVVPGNINRRTPDDSVKLVFLKAHKKIYGPDILLKALKILIRNLPSVQLTFAGEGEMTDELKQMVDHLALVSSVTFVGFIDHNKISSFLTEHDIMVMPSRIESFGVAALEASAAGIPVVASRVGGIPEVVRDGETGLMVPPNDPQALADAIIKLATDRSLREKMGNAGRKFVAENYCWDDNIKQMISVYERVLARH